MSHPFILGLDLSIAATGAAWQMPECSPVAQSWKMPSGEGDYRLVRIASAVQSVAADGAFLAVIEDLPTHAHSAGITGMVQGAVRVELIRLGVPYALVAPATLKKFATGKGNADKTAMALAACKRAGMEFADDNACDAAWLWWAGMVALGHPQFDLPAAQVAALETRDWPGPTIFNGLSS